MKNAAPDIVVYGGTFDPPHQGHIDCVTQALKRFPAARVIVTPTKQPPSVNQTSKIPVMDFADRVRMTKAAFATFGDRVHVDELEASLSVPNYTVATLRQIAKRDPSGRIGLLIGQDQLASFEYWYRVDELLRLADLIVIKRDRDARYGGDIRRSAEAFAGRIGESLKWDTVEQGMLIPLKTTIHVIDCHISIASSTMIRDFLATGRPLPQDWIPSSVDQVIADHKLYQARST